MVYYAEIINNATQRVVSFPTSVIMQDGIETDSKGSDYCSEIFTGTWVRISYPDERTTPFTYNQPFDSWISNSRNEWFAPDPAPQGTMFSWDEESLSWIEVAL